MKDFDDRRPVAQRTSMTEAWGVICGLAETWESLGLQEENMNFMDSVYEVMWSYENTNGEFEIERLQETLEITELKGKPILPDVKMNLLQVSMMLISCAFAIQAMKAKENSPSSWAYACEANFWLGHLIGVVAGRGVTHISAKLAMSALGKKGADAAHAENRALKKAVFEWCELNMANFKSMDSAAIVVSGALVPVTFRTARSWIADWKKKVQSTGTL